MEIKSRHLDVWWNALIHPDSAGRLVIGEEPRPGFNRFLIIGIACLYALYGTSMGMFFSPKAALLSALKLPFLFLLTILVCYPALYVMNCRWGPRLRSGACLRLLLLATSANAVALGSYAPVSCFLTLTSSRASYTFLVLMHVAVFAISGLTSVLVLILVFRSTAEKTGRSLTNLFVWGWGILYALVGTQMAWVLRPWIGARAFEYTFFRPSGGTFIESVLSLFHDL